MMVTTVRFLDLILPILQFFPIKVEFAEMFKTSQNRQNDFIGERVLRIIVLGRH